MTSTSPSACPSDLALEQHLLEPSRQVGFHAELCPRCQRWLEAARGADQEYQRRAPRLLVAVRQALVDAKPRPAPVPARLLRLAVPVASLAALVWVTVAHFGTTAQPEPRFAIKGSGLQVFVRHGEQVRTALDGERVEPGDGLRFFVAPERGEYVWVVSVDAKGQLSRLAPAEGAGPARLAEPGLLPGSATLDDTSGPERIYALFSQTPLPWAKVEAGFREAMAGASGEGQVRAGVAPKLDGVRHATVLLERGAP